MNRKKLFFIKKRIIITIIIVIAITLMYFIYGMLMRDKKEILSTTSVEVQELYSLLGKVTQEFNGSSCDGLLAYNTGKTMLNDLSNEKRLCYIYHNLNENDIKVKEYSVDSNTKVCKISEVLDANWNLLGNNQNWQTPDSCIVREVSFADVDRTNIRIFGNDSKINHPNESGIYKNFLIAPYVQTKTDKEIYYFIYNEEGGIHTQNNYRFLVSANRTRNEIHIYDYYIYFDEEIKYDEETFDVTYTCYQDKNKENKIGSCDYTVMTESYIQTNGGYYKHTFRENNDGNYYWYSSELMKEFDI